MEQDKGLQGLRGFASIQVLFYHIVVVLPFILPLPFLYTGYSGVELFFVISGYILTKKYLAGDYNIQQKFSAGKYYLRRIFRIWPIYLLFVPIYALTDHTPLLWQQFLFLQNYLTSTFVSNPLWTLTVEELFYVILPIWILLFIKRWKVALAGAVGITGIWSAVIYFVGSSATCYGSPIMASAPTCFSYLESQFPFFVLAYALGTIIALGKIFKLQSYFVLLVWILILIMAQGTSWDNFVFFSVLSYFIVGNLRESKLFANRLMNWLGSLTYSIYILGAPMLAVGIWLFPHSYLWIPFDIFGSIAGAWVLNKTVEKYFILLGHKIEARIL